MTEAADFAEQMPEPESRPTLAGQEITTAETEALVKEAIAFAKASPGKLTYGSLGGGVTGQLYPLVYVLVALKHRIVKLE